MGLTRIDVVMYEKGWKYYINDIETYHVRCVDLLHLNEIRIRDIAGNIMHSWDTPRFTPSYPLEVLKYLYSKYEVEVPFLSEDTNMSMEVCDMYGTLQLILRLNAKTSLMVIGGHLSINQYEPISHEQGLEYMSWYNSIRDIISMFSNIFTHLEDAEDACNLSLKKWHSVAEMCKAGIITPMSYHECCLFLNKMMEDRSEQECGLYV